MGKELRQKRRGGDYSRILKLPTLLRATGLAFELSYIRTGGIDASLCELLWVKGDKTITDKPGNNGFYQGAKEPPQRGNLH